MTSLRPRLIFAVVLAPIIGCAVGTMLYGSTFALLNPDREHFDVLPALAVLPVYGIVYGLTIGIAAMLFLGLPVHVLLCHFRQRHVWGYALSGIVAGWVTPFLLMSIVSLSSGALYPVERALDDAQRTAPLAVLIGLCIAVTAWLIRRPDRDVANPVTSAP